MNLAEVRRLYAYDEWANARLFEAAAALTEQRFTAAVVSSFPSFRDTLAHIVAVEWIWLQRWQAEGPSAAPSWGEKPSLAVLRAKLNEVEGERDRFLSRLTPEDLERTIEYRRLNGETLSNRLADLLLHVVNHSTYHRGQLTTILRQLGAQPPGTDFVLFARETRSSA